MTRNDRVVVYRTPWRAGAFEPRCGKRGRGAACPHALPSARAPPPSEMSEQVWNRYLFGAPPTPSAMAWILRPMGSLSHQKARSGVGLWGEVHFSTSDFRPAEAGGPALGI